MHVRFHVLCELEATLLAGEAYEIRRDVAERERYVTRADETPVRVSEIFVQLVVGEEADRVALFECEPTEQSDLKIQRPARDGDAPS